MKKITATLLITIACWTSTTAFLLAQETVPDRCSNSFAIPDPEPEGLVADCNILLAAKETLQGDGRDGRLNWSPNLSIFLWQGIRFPYSYDRIRYLEIPSRWYNNNRAYTLTGQIPPVLGQLSALHSLIIYAGHLTGTIPPELGNLGHLQYLSIYAGHLTGTIPPELGNLGYLQSLTISSSNLTGTLPPELGKLRSLRTLQITSNPQLTGTLPAAWGQLRQLEYLDISNNSLIIRRIPPEWADMGADARYGSDTRSSGMEFYIRDQSTSIRWRNYPNTVSENICIPRALYDRLQDRSSSRREEDKRHDLESFTLCDHPTATPTATPTPTATHTATADNLAPGAGEATEPIPTATPTATPTVTDTPTVATIANNPAPAPITPTHTATPTATVTPTPTVTLAAAPGGGGGGPSIPRATVTPVPTATPVPGPVLPIPTVTPEPTATREQSEKLFLPYLQKH